MADNDGILVLVAIVAAIAFILSVLDPTELDSLDVLGHLTADTAHINNLTTDHLNVTGVTMDSFVLTTPAEEDLRIGAELLNIRGVSNTPQWETFKGSTEGLSFDKTTMEQVFTSVQIPHAHATGYPLEPHFHTTTKTALNGTGIFCLEYACANLTEVFQTNTVTTCATVNITDTAYFHWYSRTSEDLPALKHSAMCLMRIYRNASDVRDTYDNDIILTEFDIHYHANKLGFNT